MRIRTRHTLFKVLIALGVLTYLVFLYDILLNDSAWFVYVMGAFVVLILLTLLLYLGVKPDVEPGDIMAAETVEAEPEADELPETEAEPQPQLPPPTPDEAVEVVEIPKQREHVDPSRIRGPHHYRCPFCSRVFSMEATHLDRRRDLRVSCPYCANHIRIPSAARIVVGDVPRGWVPDSDQIAFHCQNCGEVMRFSAPASGIRRRLNVQTCPHCGSGRLGRAVVGT